MFYREEITNDFAKLFRLTAEEALDENSFEEICLHLNISRLTYEIEFGEDNKYRQPGILSSFPGKRTEDGSYVLFDNGQRTDLKLAYQFYHNGKKHVQTYLEFKKGISRDQVDPELMQFFSDVVCTLVSHMSLQNMLVFAETTDAQTGIPNIVSIGRKYNIILNSLLPEDLVVLRINLRNFKYINEAAGARTGDEAIIQYSRKLLSFVGQNEGVCRLGGDNFVVVVHRDNYNILTEKLKCVLISNLKSAPGQTFDISAWIGVSMLNKGEKKAFIERMNDASVALDLAKGRFRKNLVVFDDSLVEVINKGREIISLFRPAIKKHEFQPFFQAKVEMKTGKLVGFEALCRWIHNGHFIYPDQFIPVLDQNSLIPDLDLTIFRETCAAIRQWKNMGFKPPLISSNFSKKNLFVPGIEEKIVQAIDDYDLVPEEVEIEITESVKEVEYEPLMGFVKSLKKSGVHISIDDFGTGYSSLSLIHNIDADVIKIDRSFVDQLPGDDKSKILIESIINIANRLSMSVVAEGVETEEQGRTLIELGCRIAQGYYYSKPVDFDTATRLIENPEFKVF